MIGKNLAHYRVGEQLGRGGMGEVYVADDLNLNRKVALKFLPDAFTGDPERMARFEREAKLLASLNHPNIAAIHGLEEAEGKRFIVMELVEGETLAQRLSKGALPVDEALAICRQIAEGLEAAHEKGVIHRDLKPANVMISEGDKVKILDFGLAKALSDETQSVDSSQSPTLTEAMTRPGVILGTAAYMSPEQAKGKAVDKRVDIWAFGCILYECLTGKRAFEGDTVTETLAAVLTKELELATVSAKVRPLLHRCLEKDPKKRLRDIGEAMVWVESPPESVPARKPRFLQTWAAIATLLAIALATAVTLLVRSRPAAEDDRSMWFQVNTPEMPPFSGLPSVSPDGRYIAFVGKSEGKYLLFVRPLDGLESRPLQGTEDALYPFWSPDSQFIGFGAGGKVKKVSVSGGYPETLCELPGTQLFRGGTWNSAGVLLFACASGPLHRIPASGGRPVAVTAIDQNRQEGTHIFPSFLPDGRHFLFTVRSTRPENTGVYIGALDSGERKRVVRGIANAVFADPGLLLFGREGGLLAQRFNPDRLEAEGDPVIIVQQGVSSTGSRMASFAVSKTNLLVYRSGIESYSTPMIWVGRDGGQIGAAYAAFGQPAVSPDGNLIAAVRIQEELNSTDIWLIDTSRGVDEPLTRHPAWDQHPVWSSDGKRIAFASEREGHSQLFQMRIDGSRREEQLLDSTTTIRSTDWSPDARFIIYRRDDPRTNTDLWALPLFGDRKPFPIADSEFGEAQGKVSPDGRWIAYSSDESGQPEIYVQAFPSRSGRRKVSISGGSDPRWRRNGKELFYVGADGKMMAVPSKLGEECSFGTPVALFDAKISNPIRESTLYDVSADGQRFVLKQPYDSPSQLNVIFNWTSLLKK
jgi:eukaryotic-like serine/threonine-protein kinase